MLERSICYHKSCNCLCELQTDQNKNFLFPRFKRMVPFGGRKLKASAQFCQSHFPSQELALFLGLLLCVLASPCACFSCLFCQHWIVLSCGKSSVHPYLHEAAWRYPGHWQDVTCQQTGRMSPPRVAPSWCSSCPTCSHLIFLAGHYWRESLACLHSKWCHTGALKQLYAEV